jgi:hypothetical protein
MWRAFAALALASTVGCSDEVFSTAGRSDAAAQDDSATDASADGGPRKLIAFVTTLGYAGVTTKQSADAKCQAEADGRLPGKFVAWYSDFTESAPARLVDSNGVPVVGPWFRVDGKRVAATRAALVIAKVTPLESPINLTATNKTNNGAVWTGTHADGTVGETCPGSTKPTTGAPDHVGQAWTDQAFFAATCADSLGLYCFQVE